MPYIHDSPPPDSRQPDAEEVRRQQYHEADAVVVGAGIFGCAMAITLARQGRSVMLLEKSLKYADRIVGELLQPGGVDALEKLGLRECLDDIDAIVVKGYEVIYHREPVDIPYPALLGNTDKNQRTEGRSFHHGRFIQRLREVAMREPNLSVVETTATELVTCGQTGHVLGVEALTKGEQDYYFAPLTIICDGYASKFRKSHIRYSPVSKSKFYGLELQDVTLPNPLHGHVVLGNHSPILLYQIGTRETRILVDVPENTDSASVANGGVKGHLRNVILPDLPPQVQPAFLSALDGNESSTTKQTLRSMPNSFLPPSTNTTPGLLILGDAMNMRHPLTGGGMTVAFNDVLLLSTLLPSSLHNTDAVLEAMRRFHWRRKNLTSTINILAQALYSLFAATDPQLKALQKGCFRYFQLGGACIDGPVGLLAGVTRRPIVLFYHFFSVALFAMWLYIVEPFTVAAKRARWPGEEPVSVPVPVKSSRMATRAVKGVIQLPVRVIGSALVFYKACVVIFPYIFSELRA